MGVFQEVEGNPFPVWSQSTPELVPKCPWARCWTTPNCRSGFLWHLCMNACEWVNNIMHNHWKSLGQRHYIKEMYHVELLLNSGAKLACVEAHSIFLATTFMRHPVKVFQDSATVFSQSGAEPRPTIRTTLYGLTLPRTHTPSNYPIRESCEWVRMFAYLILFPHYWCWKQKHSHLYTVQRLHQFG